MRERIINGDLQKFQPHEVLEYLLFSFIPRRDTNALAHELINKFGSFNGVLNADSSSLAQVPGMTQNAALFLSSLPVVFRQYLVNLHNPKTKLSGRGEVRDYMWGMCIGLTEERAIVAALDAQDNVLACDEFSKGTADKVQLHIRDIVNFVMRRNGSKVIIAHNHPSGNTYPSPDDIAFTKELHYTLETMELKLLDHFIFTNENYYSFESSGRMKEIENHTTELKEGVWKHEPISQD